MNRGKIISFLFLMIVSFLISCSSSRKYKILSMFFDGVPDPSKKEIVAEVVIDSAGFADSTQLLSSIVARPAFIIHPPYQKKECESCHNKNQMGKFVQPQPDLCYQCHDDLTKSKRFLHGPVGGGYCTACHAPHLAKLENLLLASDRDLCFKCHDSETVIAKEIHENIGETSCIECHDPHGSESKVFLQEGVCYQCHEDFNEKNQFLHGPVAAGYCSSCHGLHTSESENLLLETGQQLCFNCHETRLLKRVEAHKDIGNTICTECHNPHAGDDRYLLN